MGDYGYDDEYDEQDEHNDSRGDGPAGLRAANKRMEKELRELRKKLDESQKTISELSTKTRSSSLADLLRSKGVNPKLAGLVPDSVEATEDSVNAWLDEYKDVLPLGKTTEDSTTRERTSTSDGDELLPDSHRFDEDEEEDDEVAAMREVFDQMQRATAGARPGGNRQDVTTKLDEIGESATSFDDAVKAMNALPGFKVAHYQS